MNDTSRKNRAVLRIILIEGLVNVCVLAAKVVVGLSTGSLAVLGDAIHSLTDVTNNIVAWGVIRLSGRPADREHPYGHRKFETLAVFCLGSLLVVLAFELALSAIRKEDIEVLSEPWELGVMLAVLSVNIALATWERFWARRLDSDILYADASHTFADVLTTIVVIVGWQLSALGYVWLDRVCAVGVACLVLYLAYCLFMRAIPVLVDRFAIDPELLTTVVQDIAGVRGVPQVRSRWIGSICAVDMIILVDPLLPTEDAHNITDEVESLLKARFQVSDISIHVEPDIDAGTDKN